MAVHELIKKYCPNPVLVIVDVAPKEDFEIPAKSYISVETIPEVQN
jgi:26S proteasome regulatory subunit N8